MQKKLILIRTSGQVEQITVSDELELETLQGLVGVTLNVCLRYSVELRCL